MATAMSAIARPVLFIHDAGMTPLAPVRPMFPWPFGEFDNVMDEALDIAMDYLIGTDQAVKFREV
jgi:hypothetical protein